MQLRCTPSTHLPTHLQVSVWRHTQPPRTLLISTTTPTDLASTKARGEHTTYDIHPITVRRRLEAARLPQTKVSVMHQWSVSRVLLVHITCCGGLPIISFDGKRHPTVMILALTWFGDSISRHPAGFILAVTADSFACAMVAQSHSRIAQPEPTTMVLEVSAGALTCQPSPERPMSTTTSGRRHMPSPTLPVKL